MKKVVPFLVSQLCFLIKVFEGNEIEIAVS
jgi:hypothetical protein